MALKKLFSILLVSSAFLQNTYGQSEDDCVPGKVQQIFLSANATLYWNTNPDEPCEITMFKIDITGYIDEEYHFKVTQNHVDLSFLEICEEWRFAVTPISHGVLGYERHIVDQIPLPTNADISLRYLNVRQVGRDLHLDWTLTSHVNGDCTLRYLITIEDEDMGHVQEIYVSGPSTVLYWLSPCVNYKLGVRSVNWAYPTIEGPVRYTSYILPPEPEEAPRLRSIEIGTTTVDMFFDLEDAGRNRCPVRTIYVDGGNNFNISIPIINDEDRPPVKVGLRNLQPNSMYLLRISVENSGGISRRAQLGVQTLDLSSSSG